MTRRERYAYARARYLRQHRWCEARLCVVTLPDSFGIPKEYASRATEVHHKRGRLAERLLNEDEWVAVCPDCHRWIHEHPAEATERGLLLSRHAPSP